MARTHDLVVIGAGAAGLTAAGGCARLGLRVALVERGRMGGECLNTGCVPSKTLLAAAHRAHAVRDAARFGIRAGPPEVDFARVRASVAAAIAAIAPHDAPERFEAWGVEVIRADATLLDRTGRVSAGGRVLSAPRIVLATGSVPAVPPVPGLDTTPFLTNETLWDLDRLPGHLLVLGGGGVGIEMAQAFRRLGAAVTIVGPRLLPRDDPEAAAVVLARLAAEGVVLRPGTEAAAATATASGVRLSLSDGTALDGTHLLVAAGRRAATENLGLDAAGVAVDPGGIRVDARLRTTNPRISAVGDARDGPRFTHAAGQDGALIVSRLGLGLPARIDRAALPWTTFTDPELTQVGLTEPAARARHGSAVTVHRQDFTGNDRAVAEADTAGFVKLVTLRGRVLGATVVGPGAGDLVLPWSLAIAGKASLWAIANATLPYPTRSETAKAAAFAAFEPRIFGPAARAWARSLARLRR